MPTAINRELSVADHCERGDYESAARTLQGWRGIGLKPIRYGRTDLEYAEALQWCAVISVEFSLLRQAAIGDSARDMLTESARLSNSSAPLIWLGICYYRCGEYGEAEALLSSCLDTDLCPNDRLLALRNLAVVFTYQGKLNEALDLLDQAAPLLPLANLTRRGKFYLQRGLIRRKQGHLDRAISDYEKASSLFEEASNHRYEAAVSNNLAGVFCDQRKFAQAHAHAERSVSLFSSIGDKLHEAKAWDQIARIHLMESNLVSAERAARRAISLVETGEQGQVLAECLITHGIVLSHRAISEAAGSLERASDICARIGDEDQKRQADAELSSIVKNVKVLLSNASTATRPIEHRLIKESLERHSGIVTRVSAELGMPKETIFKKLRTQFPDLMDARRPVVKRKSRSRVPGANAK